MKKFFHFFHINFWEHDYWLKWKTKRENCPLFPLFPQRWLHHYKKRPMARCYGWPPCATLREKYTISHSRREIVVTCYRGWARDSYGIKRPSSFSVDSLIKSWKRARCRWNIWWPVWNKVKISTVSLPLKMDESYWLIW